MSEEADAIEFGGRRIETSEPHPHRTPPFLAIWYRCCHTYGRLYRNRDETMYEGRCPRCGARVHALIGPDGTGRRMFEAI